MARRVGFKLTAAVAVALVGSSVALASTPVPMISSASTTANPWLALAATQGQADLSQLCYYDPSRRNWIPADSNRADQVRPTDPSPAYREARGAALGGRCGSGPPVAALAVIAATVATAIFIAAKDDNNDVDITVPVSPA